MKKVMIDDGRLERTEFTDPMMNTGWMSLGLDSLDITEIRTNLYEGMLSLVGSPSLKRGTISGKMRNLRSPEFIFENSTPREAIIFSYSAS